MKGLLVVFVLLSPLAAAIVESAVVCGKNDTVLPNPEDCSSFILCDNGVPTVIQCPPGLEFNAEARVCDLPFNANCQTSSGTQEPTEPTTPTPDPPTTQPPTTQPPTTQPPTTQPPTTQPPTTQQPTTQPPTTQPPTTQPPTQNTEEPSTGPPPTQEPTTETPNSDACPENGTVIIPNPDSCSSFLVCVNGESSVVECPNGWLFNPDENACDRAENVPCWTETTTDEQQTTDDDDVSTPEPNTTTEPASICPSTGTEIIPNPESCSSFLVCINGNATAIECPDGLLFNSTELACQNADQVSCGETTTEEEVTPTEEPGYPNCPDEGYEIFPNLDDCSSFFVCANGASGIIYCPDGLYFNVNTSRCDSEENSSCSGSTGSTDEPEATETTTVEPFIPECPEEGIVQLPNPYDCNSFFICINSAYTELKCPSNFTFDYSSQSCQPATNSSCNSLSADPWVFVCPGEGSYVDPEDCGRYYVCVAGSPIHMDCPAGLYFNEELGTCLTEPVAGTCNSGGSTGAPTTSGTPEITTATPTAPPTTQSPTTQSPTTQNPTTISPTTLNPTTSLPTTTGKPGFEPQCPPSGTSKLPNPQDCSSFYVCIEGDYALINCPNGYYYDAVVKNCDLEENVQCDLDNNEGPKCPSQGTAVVPNPKDCGSYYLCINGQHELIECPSNLEFNNVTGFCDTPENAQCSVSLTTNQPSTVTSTPTTSPPSTTGKPGSGPQCPSTGTSKLPNPNDCSSFYICIEGEYALVYCPDGYYYDANIKNCDLAGNVQCDLIDTPKCPADGVVILPNPKDCGSYFICINGEHDLVECPTNLEFNNATGFCDTPENAKCSASPSSTSVPPTGSTLTPSSSTTQGTNPTDGTTEKPSSNSPTSTNPPVTGSCETGEILPNPDDCSTFFLCDSGIGFEMKCPDGLLFNPVAKVCDNPENVVCAT